MKLAGKIDWVSLNSMSKKLFQFDSNIFCCFKDHFFKVLDSSVVVNGLPLMLNKDGEPRFYSTGRLIPPGLSLLMKTC